MVRRPSIWTALFLPVLVLADSFQPRATGCNRNCGGVDIPFPFGVEDGCFLPGFGINCTDGGTPILADNPRNLKVLNLTVMPRPEALVMLPIAYQCYNTTDGAIKPDESFDGNSGISPVYRISNTMNELVVLGCSTVVYTGSVPVVGCVGYCNDNDSMTEDGACAGNGCCRVEIAPGLVDSTMVFQSSSNSSLSHERMDISPCDYAFIVAKNSYRFRVSDLNMDGRSITKPQVLDWAIRGTYSDDTMSAENMTCPEVKNTPEYACVSVNSECLNSTNGPGYFCNCTKGYWGNPYLMNGCQGS
jgi:hypothetical protein